MKFISQLSSFLSIILGIIFTGCENHSNKTKNIDIYPIKEITEYADSTYFFGLINNSTATDSFIVLNDRKLKRAILYDTSLNYIRMIGGGGKGPKEFIGLEGNPIVDDNYIYLYDIGRNKIKIFTTQGKYIKSFNYPFKSGADFIHFDYDKDKNNKFYSSSYLTNKPVFKFNQNGIILNEYGKFIPSIDNRHKRVQNYRHVIHHNNKIIAINIRKPRIEIFSANNGKLIKQYNFNHFFEFYLNSAYSDENGQLFRSKADSDFENKKNTFLKKI